MSKPVELYVNGNSLNRSDDLLALLASAREDCVITIDAIDKVHPRIHDLLIQVIEHGVVEVEIGPADCRKILMMRLPKVTFIGKSSTPDRINPDIVMALTKQLVHDPDET